MQPTNYTISYYQGDDFSLIIYPKDSAGQPIPFNTGDTAFFNVANIRGDLSTIRIQGVATIASPSGGIPAVIATMTGAQGANIDSGFVYDIGYVKSGKKTTVLTGTFSVVEDVVA